MAQAPSIADLSFDSIPTYFGECLQYYHDVAAYKRKIYRSGDQPDPENLVPMMKELMKKEAEERGDPLKEIKIPTPKVRGGKAIAKEREVKENEKTPIDNYLENYIKVYNMSKDKLAHLEYVKQQVFLPHKLGIMLDANLGENAKYEWLGGKDACIVLKYDPNNRNNKSINKQIKIYLSSIYRDALLFRKEKLAEAKEKEIQENKFELSYPTGIVYCLYRLFAFCTTDPVEVETLGKHIIYLRNKLGLTSAEKPKVGTSALSKAISKYTKGKVNLTDVPGSNNELINTFVNVVAENKELDALATDLIGDIDFGAGGLEIMADVMCKATDQGLLERISKASVNLNADNLPDEVKRMIPKGAVPADGTMPTAEAVSQTILNATKLASEKFGEDAPNQKAVNDITASVQALTDSQIKQAQQANDLRSIINIPKKPMVTKVNPSSSRLVI